MQPASASPELVLPGLEAPVVTEPSVGHWIERGPQKRLMVFSGRSHVEVAERISEQLGVELGEIQLDTFPNGETYCRYDESIRGSDIFLVQTGCSPIDRNLMELLQMIQAARLGSAKRITAVIPLFPYARQDRKAKPREPMSRNVSTTDHALANFSDDNTFAQADWFAATIYWGDGNSDTGVIKKNNDGTFSVWGSHTYAEIGKYTAVIVISCSDSGSGGSPALAASSCSPEISLLL